jgi:hypothetical protein
VAVQAGPARADAAVPRQRPPTIIQRWRRLHIKEAALLRHTALAHTNEAGDQNDDQVRAHKHAKGAKGSDKILFLGDLAHYGEGDSLAATGTAHTKGDC